jgi:hypothetical protein
MLSASFRRSVAQETGQRRFAQRLLQRQGPQLGEVELLNLLELVVRLVEQDEVGLVIENFGCDQEQAVAAVAQAAAVDDLHVFVAVPEFLLEPVRHLPEFVIEVVDGGAAKREDAQGMRGFPLREFLIVKRCDFVRIGDHHAALVRRRHKEFALGRKALSEIGGPGRNPDFDYPEEQLQCAKEHKGRNQAENQGLLPAKSHNGGRGLVHPVLPWGQRFRFTYLAICSSRRGARLSA